jgi:hypothetical protein
MITHAPSVASRPVLADRERQLVGIQIAQKDVINGRRALLTLSMFDIFQLLSKIGFSGP